MIPTLVVDDGHITEVLDAIGPNVRQRLIDVLTPFADAIADDAKARAEAHIRYLGRLGTPGLYLASIHGGVSTSNPQRTIGWARAGNQLANFLEGGPDPFAIGPHEILPDAGGVLAFEGDAGTVFARAVHSPGAEVPRYPVIHPAFEARRDDILDAINQVAREAGQGIE